jgi:hypothetical protein
VVAALTLMAPSRACESRSGADRRSLHALGLRRLPSGSAIGVGPFAFCFRWGDGSRGMVLEGWLPGVGGSRCGAGASYGVGFEATRLATGWHYGVPWPSGDLSICDVLKLNRPLHLGSAGCKIPRNERRNGAGEVHFGGKLTAKTLSLTVPTSVLLRADE